MLRRTGKGVVIAKRVALYLRVSTSEQTVENQQRELQAVADRHGWKVVAIFKDEGVSGAKGRDRRPGYRQLLEAVARREFDEIAAWSVDRLGRSLQDLIAFLAELHAKFLETHAKFGELHAKLTETRASLAELHARFR